MNDPRIIVALDYAEAAPAVALARQLDPALCRVKVGKELFVSAGPAVIETLHDLGHSVFLDLKFHDIPHTVSAACAAAARLGVWMVNVHASGGLAMMVAARAALAEFPQAPKLIAVTVLTSMGREDLAGIGLDVDPPSQVLRLARLSQQAGLDGVVCSAQEATLLTAELGAGFIKVTPGIRPAGSATGDQRRILTPTAAVAAGADYLVIGRPITQAVDPLAALQAIHAELL
jgi:orotidine-5'-phosphate decarboxylase